MPQPSAAALSLVRTSPCPPKVTSTFASESSITSRTVSAPSRSLPSPSRSRNHDPNLSLDPRPARNGSPPAPIPLIKELRNSAFPLRYTPPTGTGRDRPFHARSQSFFLGE